MNPPMSKKESSHMQHCLPFVPFFRLVPCCTALITDLLQQNKNSRPMTKDTVKLISAEGFEFIVDYPAACVSNTIKNMLSSSGEFLDVCITRCQQHSSMYTSCIAGSFTETELGEVRFPEISTPVLEKVCQYFYFKLRHQNS